MFFKIYDQNDKALIESVKLAGLSEYKVQKLIRFANENKVSIQKAYLLTDANIIKVDTILFLVISFFVFSIAQEYSRELWVFF
ncbi:hypothetical protein NFK79_18110 [Citrobacter freundii]|nr:hypothetical protein [Citrobacter freundii]WFZ84017.1 hypothetical protein NFK79_18110 [Citrobacter freundii]